ncbi:MAG: sensor histidine kinase, partial [Oscillospiraceae bacterium]
MAIKKITKRWLFNSFFVILLILIVLIIGFSLGIRGYYYSSAMQTLRSRVDVVGTLLKNYAENPSVDFEAKVRQIVEEFDAKENMELIAIDNKGKVLLTSSGFAPDGIADYQGVVSGENIMSVTLLSPVKNDYISALRIVTSLDRVDGQIMSFIVIIGLVGVAIIFFVIFSSSYFISSIVNPV